MTPAQRTEYIKWHERQLKHKHVDVEHHINRIAILRNKTNAQKTSK